MTTSAQQAARTLRDHVEPLVAQVYFSPECHGGHPGVGGLLGSGRQPG